MLLATGSDDDVEEVGRLGRDRRVLGFEFGDDDTELAGFETQTGAAGQDAQKSTSHRCWVAVVRGEAVLDQALEVRRPVDGGAASPVGERRTMVIERGEGGVDPRLVSTQQRPVEQHLWADVSDRPRGSPGNTLRFESMTKDLDPFGEPGMTMEGLVRAMVQRDANTNRLVATIGPGFRRHLEVKSANGREVRKGGSEPLVDVVGDSGSNQDVAADVHLDQRAVDEGPQLRPDRICRRRHELGETDDREVLDRIDPEGGGGCTTPPVLAY